MCYHHGAAEQQTASPRSLLSNLDLWIVQIWDASVAWW